MLKNIFGIFALILAGFFFYIVNVLAFVHEPPSAPV
jgi:hypothetical protein